MNSCQGQTTVCPPCDLTPLSKMVSSAPGKQVILAPSPETLLCCYHSQRWSSPSFLFHWQASTLNLLLFHGNEILKWSLKNVNSKYRAHKRRQCTYRLSLDKWLTALQKQPICQDEAGWKLQARVRLYSEIIWSPLWVADQTFSSNFSCHGLHEHKCSSASSPLTFLPHICCIISHNHLTPGCSI